MQSILFFRGTTADALRQVRVSLPIRPRFFCVHLLKQRLVDDVSALDVKGLNHCTKSIPFRSAAVLRATVANQNRHVFNAVGAAYMCVIRQESMQAFMKWRVNRSTENSERNDCSSVIRLVIDPGQNGLTSGWTAVAS